MAKHGVNQLDELDEIQINFAAFRCPAPSPGLLITLLWEFHPLTESRTYYKDGKFNWVGPFAGLKKVNFPGPIGEQEVCYIPHPETRTMPKSLGAKAVSVHGCFPPRVMELAKIMLEFGLYNEEPVTIKGIETNPFDLSGGLWEAQRTQCKGKALEPAPTTGGVGRPGSVLQKYRHSAEHCGRNDR
jgi:saccharopine dehydrogenase-like NADP-dependent oxidoreductase